MRVNISVAIVAMTDNSENPDFEEFDWDGGVKSILLSSFIWGYTVTQIPAGPLARKFGPKMCLLVGMLISGLLNLLTPIAARGGWEFVCALRAIEGFFQGVFFSCVHALLAKWAPQEERARLGTFCYAGCQMGTVIMMGLSGVFTSSGLGWPGIFYFSGGIGIIWCAIWLWLGANSPAQCHRISSEEREMIEHSLALKEINGVQQEVSPLKTVVFSIPFLALILTHTASVFENWMLLTEIPAYLKGVMGMDMKTNALFSALPYLGMLIMSFVFVLINNFIVSRNYFSLGARRKTFNTISQWLPAIFLIALGYITQDNSAAAMIALILTVSLTSAKYLGFMVNHIDLSPTYAGILMGLANFIAQVVALLGPLIVGQIVIDNTDLEQWRIIFWITAAFLFVGNLAFVAFGKVHPI